MKSKRFAYRDWWASIVDADGWLIYPRPLKRRWRTTSGRLKLQVGELVGKDRLSYVNEPIRINAEQRHPIVTRAYSAQLPTIHGQFEMAVYHDADGKEHTALVMGPMDDAPLVRIHSECLTGDVFGSVRCDCRDQLLAALASIGREGCGMVVYLRQEGRGIGLANKIHAYALQDQGLDTVDANLHLGFPADGRTYSAAAAILLDHGVGKVRLLTNNPRKIADLEAQGIEVVERVPHEIPPRPENQRYLDTKAAKLGHLLGDATVRILQEANE